jgi:hypothetical protein
MLLMTTGVIDNAASLPQASLTPVANADQVSPRPIYVNLGKDVMKGVVDTSACMVHLELRISSRIIHEKT